MLFDCYVITRCLELSLIITLVRCLVLCLIGYLCAFCLVLISIVTLVCSGWCYVSVRCLKLDYYVSACLLLLRLIVTLVRPVLCCV